MAAQALWTMASCVEIPQDAPVVRNKEGKKRRPDGQCCEALGPDGEVCGEFFSSSWYAQNRCCAKADCKRYFGVAGVYQPKKAKTTAAPLADRSNEQRSQQQPPPLQQHQPPPQATPPTVETQQQAGRQPAQPPAVTAAAAAQQVATTIAEPHAPRSAEAQAVQHGFIAGFAAPPGAPVSLPLGAAIECFSARFGDGCWRHEAGEVELLDCACCRANAAAFAAVKEAEFEPYLRSADLVVLRSFKVKAGVGKLTIESRDSTTRFAPHVWAGHMEVRIWDVETDRVVLTYEGGLRRKFEFNYLGSGREFEFEAAFYASAADKELCQRHDAVPRVVREFGD